ncbi:hypothetical protein D8911_08310 [Levilactobacillus brevis]|nr:hypothetical protein D8911_08310 [Levilactobacillus brevis]
MEPAVSTVLAGSFCQVTPWGDLKDLWSWQGFQANRKTAPQAGGVPHSRRNPWQPQALAITVSQGRRPARTAMQKEPNQPARCQFVRFSI